MNEREIFAAALEQPSEADRKTFLAQTCDSAMRDRIELLLKERSNLGSFLEHPPLVDVATQLLAGKTDGDEGDDGSNQTMPQVDEISLDFLQPSQQLGSLGRWGPYEIMEVVGRGGMGIVLKAQDTKLHRVVAVKLLAPELASNPTARKRFLREAQAAAAVSHDHVVTIHAVEDSAPTENKNIPYLVMEFIDGQSLQQKIDRHGPLELKEILRIGRQIAAGLAAAHAQGLIHRDIKPANILLQNGVQRVQITDFGLARAADDASITRTGEVTGTPQYMSPEQAEGKLVDARSDLFSLGSVLYAMCTGRSPFRAETTVAALRRVCDDTPRPIREINPDVPDWLVAIIDRLLEKNAADRIQTAAEVTDLLGKHLAHLQDGGATPFPGTIAPVRKHPVTKTKRPHRWLASGLVLVALATTFGFTEATGVTHFAGTIIRIATGEGTLAIEVDDPSVQIALDGEELSITGAGIQELKLRPGQYQFQATKDGQPVKQALVTITRGDREVVRVTREVPAAGISASTVARGAFVVLDTQGQQAGKFDTLAAAVLGSTSGDTIEILSNGPFVTDPIVIRHALTIRAGSGYRPVIRDNSDNPPQAGDALLNVQSPLILEGLDIQYITQRDDQLRSNLAFATAPLHAVNCRFFKLKMWDNCILSHSSGVLKNCELISGNFGCALDWNAPANGRFVVENCLHVGLTLVNDFDVANVTLRLHGNTMMQPRLTNATFGVELNRAPQQSLAHAQFKPVRISASGNILDSATAIFAFFQSPRDLDNFLDRSEAEALLPRLLEWREQRNLYRSGDRILGMYIAGEKDLNTRRGQNLEDWDQFWGLTDTGSLQGAIRYQGGDLYTKAEFSSEQLTPEDFRLRPDSAGYRAGPDGKDLGADIDLVGPGDAYERWKRTPEYKDWQMETHELLKTAAADEVSSASGTFVILSGEGPEVGKFDTLAAAVLGSTSGDTIEILGNGPFVTDPLLIKHPLTIRAGNGFKPVIRCAPDADLSDEHPLIDQRDSLALEGIHIECLFSREDTGFECAIYSRAPLRMANCRVTMPERGFGIRSESDCNIANCDLMVQPGAAVSQLSTYGSHELILRNCVLTRIDFGDISHPKVAPLLESNTICNANWALQFWPSEEHGLTRRADQPTGTFRVHSANNVFDSIFAFLLVQEYEKWKDTFTAEATKSWLKETVVWEDQSSIYSGTGPYVVLSHATAEPSSTEVIASFADWNALWENPDNGSMQSLVRFQGGDLKTRITTDLGGLTPEDFRLRPDSAGYRAGSDGKDLGADIDLVGPGEAYERWKKTSAYKDWQNETRELMKTALIGQPTEELASGTESAKESADTKSDASREPVEDSTKEQPATSDE